jgi:hypothetical protein
MTLLKSVVIIVTTIILSFTAIIVSLAVGGDTDAAYKVFQTGYTIAGNVIGIVVLAIAFNAAEKSAEEKKKEAKQDH